MIGNHKLSFKRSFQKFVQNVLDANDPLEIIVAEYIDGNYYVKGPNNRNVDISPMIEYNIGTLSRYKNDRRGKCNILVKSLLVERPNSDPIEDFHTGEIIVTTIRKTADMLFNGDRVLILKTQKPVHYIMLGKIGTSLSGKSE
jgi:hypothetical protein